MSAFEYRAVDTAGRETRGVLEGDTARQVRQLLRDQGLTPLTVAETARREYSGSRQTLGLLSRSLSGTDRALVTRQLATLIQAGTPVEEALRAGARYTAKPHVQRLLMSLRARVVEGHSLAGALSEYPRSFPEMYVATVRAGEEAGQLAGVLQRLADYTEEVMETRGQVTGALIYPLILTAAALLIVGLLLTYVVPEIVGVFDALGTGLPTPTVVLLAVSDFMQQWGTLILAILIAIPVALVLSLRNEAFRYRFDAALLRLPGLGTLLMEIDTGRFARTLSILAASGAPVLDALGTAAQVISRRPIRAAVRKAAAQVREGESVNKALTDSGWFPPMLLQLIAIGEASGELDNMLHRAADYQERSTRMRVSLIVTLFEPALMLVMGLLVLYIALAMLLPIFELNQLVG